MERTAAPKKDELVSGRLGRRFSLQGKPTVGTKARAGVGKARSVQPTLGYSARPPPPMYKDVEWRAHGERVSSRDNASRVVVAKRQGLIKGPEGNFSGNSRLIRQRCGPRGKRKSTARLRDSERTFMN